MRIQLIQRNFDIDSKIKITRKTGEEVSGVLIGIDSDGIALKVTNKKIIQLEPDEIVGIESLGDEVDVSPPMDTEQDSSNEVVAEDEVIAEDTDTEQTEVSSASDHGSKSAVSVKTDASVLKKTIDIEKRFNILAESVELELKPPDMTFPKSELTDWQNTTVAGDWVRIKNKYDYAKNNNELGPQYGRIKPICSDLETLTKRFPGSPTLKRVLAYFYSLSDDWGNALQNYQEAAIQSKQADDWFSLAVSALKLNREELACYSLEQYFHENAVINDPETWAIYANLMATFNNHAAFRERCKNDDLVVEENLDILLDTVIYLLHKTGNEASVNYVIQKRQEEKSTKSLLVEACQFLGGEPIESYHYFLQGFRNAETSLKDKLPKHINSNIVQKTDPITPKRPKHTNVVKRPISQSNQQKQKRQTLGASNKRDQYTLYRQAEQANTIHKDLEKAERLYGECMERDIQFESALKDRAMVLARLERYEEAEKLLLLEDNRQKVKDEQSVDRLLLNIYQKWGQYQKAINLLNDFLRQTQDIEKSTDIQWQIASTYFKLEDYVNAETKFREVQKRRPDNTKVKLNIAICLLQQEIPHYDEAEEILNEIQNTSPDVETAKLLEDLQRAKVTGEFSLNEDNSKKFQSGSEFSFSNDASPFAKFFLERCKFEGVRPDRKIGEKYEAPSQRLAEADINELANTAEHPHSAGPTRPDQRAPRYLSAAKICDMGFGDRNKFYRYLCSSFTSCGDVALTEDLNTAQAWYREALIAYDKTMLFNLAKDVEIDAKGSLVRYLYAIELPSNQIPMPPSLPSIAETVKNVIGHCTEKEKVFDAIAYLVSHSKYANQQVLKVLYENSDWQMAAIAYLEKMGIPIPTSIDSQVVFTQLWKDLENKNDEKVRDISNDLGFLNGFKLSQAWLENSIRTAQDLHAKLLFELDKNRIRELQKILEGALKFCGRGSGFEERGRLYGDLKRDYQELLKEIEKKPTNLSVKYLYSIIEIVQKKVEEYYNSLCDTSKPELTLKLLTYNYMEEREKLTLQIEVENEKGRMSADSLELIIIENEAYFSVSEDTNLGLDRPLHGGEQEVLRVDLNLTNQAINTEKNKEPFSLAFHAKYSTFRDNDLRTQLQEPTIELNSEKKFEKFDNPYSWGQEVTEKEMFYGRDELISRIATVLGEAGTENRCLFVYGQYRSGKSSVRYHLKTKLENDYKQLFVVDLMNIDSISHDSAKSTFLSSLFRHIIKKSLEAAIENKIDNEDFSSLSCEIFSKVSDENNNISLEEFTSIFSDLKRTLQSECQIQQVVLLIDEFQYIYKMMLKNELNSNFMQIWKGFLQQNLFSAVLVGQLVMAKLRDKFNIDNVLGSMKPEQVTYLQREHAEQLIVNPILIKDGQSRYLGSSVERILELTGGSPYYIQRFCHNLVIRMNDVEKSDWVTKSGVDEEASKLIKNVSKLFFRNLLQSGDESEDAIPENDILTVLRAIAQISNRGAGGCPREDLDNLTISIDIDELLEELKEREVIEREHGRYSIKVGLFKEWLIHRG